MYWLPEVNDPISTLLNSVPDEAEIFAVAFSTTIACAIKQFVAVVSTEAPAGLLPLCPKAVPAFTGFDVFAPEIETAEH